MSLVTDAVVASDACNLLQGWVYWESMTNSGPSPASIGFKQGTLLDEDFWGILAAVFSLLTNVVATTLIAYRVWYVLKFPWSVSLTHSELRHHPAQATPSSHKAVLEGFVPAVAGGTDARTARGVWSAILCALGESLLRT